MSMANDALFVICNQSLLADQLVTDDKVIIANNKYLGSYACIRR